MYLISFVYFIVLSALNLSHLVGFIALFFITIQVCINENDHPIGTTVYIKKQRDVIETIFFPVIGTYLLLVVIDEIAKMVF